MPAKIRNALALYRPLTTYVEIRLHETVLYNSIFRVDDRIFVNQHSYWIPAAHAPVICFRRTAGNGSIATAYLDSYETISPRATALK